MDPLSTNRLDPAMGVIERRDGEYEPTPRRRRPARPTKPAAEEGISEPTAHQFDDLA